MMQQELRAKRDDAAGIERKMQDFSSSLAGQ